MDKMAEIKMEWEKMLECKNNMEEMMKDMPTDGMEEMKMEWDKMSESMSKMQEMMMQKGM